MNKRLSSLFIRHSSAEITAEHTMRMPSLSASRIKVSLFIFILFLLISQSICAQETAISDSIIIPKHSARKATFYSMALPGLGQAYNKKYWKIPVIYAGFGTLTYFIITNNKRYVDFKEAYQLSLKPDSLWGSNAIIEQYRSVADLSATLLRGQNLYRRNLEVSVMFTAVLYILNVVDAAVDAHFFDFSIDDDISLHVQPFMNPSPFASKQNGGLRLTLSF